MRLPGLGSVTLSCVGCGVSRGIEAVVSGGVAMASFKGGVAGAGVAIFWAGAAGAVVAIF
jgi:hypothetical protein